MLKELFPCAAIMLAAAISGAEVASQENLVLNGSFENGPVGGAPDHWNQVASGGAKATLTVTDVTAGMGGRALKISNLSPQAPHVYGALIQMVKGIVPDKEYELSLTIKGVNAKGIIVCCGKGWKIRNHIAQVQAEWTRYTFKFKVAAQELEADGRMALAIISDRPAEAIYVDSVAVYPAGKQTISAAEFQNERLWLIKKFSGVMDGITAIPKGMPTLKFPQSDAYASDGKMPKSEDFSGQAALAWDEQGLYFFIRVNDHSVNVKSGENMWRGDSVQVRIDQAGLASPHAEASDIEFGLSVDGQGKVHSWNWTNSSMLPADKAQLSGRRDSKGYFIAGRLDWNLLSGVGFPAKRNFTFSLICNDVKANGQRVVYFLTRGIHDEKNASGYIRAMLDNSEPGVALYPGEKMSTTELTGELNLRNMSAGPLEAVLRDSRGQTQKMVLTDNAATGEDHIARIKYALPLDKMAEGECRVSFTHDGKELAAYGAVKSDPVKVATVWLDAAVVRLDKIKAAYAEFYGKQPYSMYASMPLAVLADNLPALRQRFSQVTPSLKPLYVARINMIKQEVNAELDDLENMLVALKNKRHLPATWKCVPGPVLLKDGWPVTKMACSDGQTAERQVMFSGYGHFLNMKNDFVKFASYGENIVQMEQGPSHLYLKPGKDGKFELDQVRLNDFCKVLDAVRNNGLKLCLLISPHYAPKWYLAAHPEAKVATGFFPYDIAQPMGYAMMKAFIHDFVPEIKKRYPDMIHSICILNEPTYNTTLAEPVVKAAFIRYLNKTYGTPANFNAVFKTNYKDFETMAAAGADRVVKAEFIRYKREVMNNWAKFLSTEVKSVWPEIPVHAKIMMTSSSFASDHAIDPEAFALTSDYNGNDNYFNYGEGGFASDWAITAIGGEIQVSMAEKSVINSENHIIRDAETRPIPNDHIYTANFQQYITGASGLITWVWVNYLPEAEKNVIKDLQGNIALRPGNIIAHARAGLDAARLAGEISRFSRSEPEIAVIFSQTSLAYNPDSYRSSLFDFYIESAFTGSRVRFISEKQLAERQFGKVKQIFAIGATNLSRAAASGLAAFSGKVFTDKASLKKDEYDQPLPESKATRLPDFVRAPQFKNDYFDKAVTLPVTLTPVGAADTRGVFFRVVPDGDGYLINLVNYNRGPVKLKISGNGSFYDLLKDEAFRPEFELSPLRPMLLRFTPQAR